MTRTLEYKAGNFVSSNNDKITGDRPPNIADEKLKQRAIPVYLIPIEKFSGNTAQNGPTSKAVKNPKYSCAMKYNNRFLPKNQ